MVRHPLPFPFVQMLIASSPLLGNEIGATGAKHIADALMSNSSLTQLNLRCAPLLISFPHPLAQMLIAPSPLLGNQIGGAGAKHIADALMSNCSLTQLDLYGASPSHFVPTPICADAHRTISSS